MLINVSTLLTEPVGHARWMMLHDEPAPAANGANGANGASPQQVSGPVRLIRSERGVVVMADLHVSPVVLDCGRCLEAFDTSLHLEFDEEYVLDRDPVTGERVAVEEDEFRLDQRRHLDLSEAVRQYRESALPIQPLCEADCRGLCPVCGQNLNERDCECSTAQPDHRWSALAHLADELRTEETDGRPEA